MLLFFVGLFAVSEFFLVINNIYEGKDRRRAWKRSVETVDLVDRNNNLQLRLEQAYLKLDICHAMIENYTLKKPENDKPKEI